MVIKNKDGTPYKLNRPNPLVINQDNWSEEEELELHNFIWEKEISHGQKIVPIVEEKKEEETSKEELAVLEDEAINTTPPPINIDMPQKVLDNMLLIHCLMASTKEITDDLYNETRTKTVYINKLIFEGVIFNKTDFLVKIWTKENISLNSVVYPFKFKNGKPLEAYRWWKVKELDSKSGGWILTCIPSEIQPDFS